MTTDATDASSHRLMRELHGYQVELELQNEELRRALAELSDASSVNQELYDNAPVGYIACEPKGWIIRANHQAAWILGVREAKALAGRAFPEFAAPSCRDAYHRLVSTLEHVDEIRTSEMQITGEDGEHRHVQIEAQARRSGETIEEVRLCLVDVTERRLAEQRTQVASDPIVEVDRRGRIASWNDAAERVFGFARCQAVGAELESLLVSATDESPHPLAAELLSAGGLLDAVVLSRWGAEIPLEVSIGRSKSDDERTTLILRDVTERRRRESMQRRLERLEALENFAASVAHDFNNLLQGIFANLEIAMLYDGAEQNRERETALREAKQVVTRAFSMSRQLLSFARVSSPAKELLDVGELLRNQAPLSLGDSSVGLGFDIAGDLFAVRADPVQLGQLINNLVTNAVEALSDSGTIRVGAANRALESDEEPGCEPGRYVHVWIADTGSGIPPEDLGRIFDPYFSTRRRGTGLGLASAHSIAREHGGLLRAESALGQGTTIHLYLPASPDESVREPEREPPPRRELPQLRILLMDDDDAVRSATARLLAAQGHDVDTVADGQAAIDRWLEHREGGNSFDLVIFDVIVRGGMGGVPAFEKLRAIDPSIIGIVATGYAAEKLSRAPAEHGFACALMKPYDAAKLEAAIERAWSSGAPD